MDSVIIKKLNEITQWIQGILSNSKPIHELSDLNDDDELFIAVSDGQNTGKVVYKPSEVSKEEFENLKNLNLETDDVNSTLSILDQNGDVLTIADLSFLNGNNVTLNVDSATHTLQLLNYNDEVISYVELSDLVPEVQPKQKQLFIHEITELDITDPMRINLQLATIPDQDEWFDLHINGGFVNDTSYEITDTLLSIHRDQIAYPITVGKKITFRYRKL